MSINTSYYGTQEDGLEVYNFTYFGHEITVKSPAWSSAGTYARQGTYLAKAVADRSAIQTEIDTSKSYYKVANKDNFIRLE